MNRRAARRDGPLNHPFSLADTGDAEVRSHMFTYPASIGDAPAQTPEGKQAPASPRHDAIVERRARRVTLLVLATASLGLFDLAFTLTFMRSIGMYELNPLARLMIGIGGAGQLIRFKLLTIVLSSGLLYLIRRRWGAELCAWLSLAALVLLSLHWVRYTKTTEDLGPTLLAETLMVDHRWVTLSE